MGGGAGRVGDGERGEWAFRTSEKRNSYSCRGFAVLDITHCADKETEAQVTAPDPFVHIWTAGGLLDSAGLTWVAR